jgi:hypothetical protein
MFKQGTGELMKIAFLTRHYTAACSMFYVGALQKIDAEIDFYMDIPDNNKIWKEFDVVLIMTYDHNICNLVKKNIRKDCKLGIIDPRGHSVLKDVEYCDFIIVDSIEMEDFWRCSKKPIFRYAEYPDIGFFDKKHVNKKQITIGYHGNTLHLNEMSKTVVPALQNLSKKYDIKFLAMYNGNKPTGSERWYIDTLEIEHINWSMENYKLHLANADIGIVPNNLIISTEQYNAINENKNNDNYMLSFKMPSNPGRFITFGQLGIPVVADFFPSAIQYLQEGTGYVAHSISGWEYCLEQLIISADLRQKMGDRLQKLVKEKFDFKIQNKKFVNFLEGLV